MARFQQYGLGFGVILITSVTLSAQTPLCPGMTNGPTIVDPTAATCVYDAANDAAVITLNREAVLDWSRVNQGSDSSLTFTFDQGVSNPSVLNRLGTLNPRLGDHRFEGNIQSNGRVVFLSPETGVLLSGDITVGELVAVVNETTAAGEAALLNGGQAVDFHVDLPAAPTTHLLTVRDGQITSTQGDVVLGAARSTTILNSNIAQSNIQSAQATRLFSGNHVRYDPGASGREKVSSLSNNEDNNVIHGGTIVAGTDIEMRAGDGGQISVDGFVSAQGGNAPYGRIFLRVTDGTIDLQDNAVLVGIVQTTDELGSTILVPNEGDSPGLSNPSVSLFPSLRKGSANDLTGERTKEVRVIRGSPVSASGSASRASSEGNKATAKKEKKSQRALVKRSGFFGLRSAKVSKR